MAVASQVHDRQVAFESDGFTLRARCWLPATTERIGLVCCHALGEEKKSSHRSLVHLATSLTTSNIPVFMFDYAGCGDSDGDDADGNLTRWYGNVRDAIKELVAHSMVERVVLLGVRLGAWLALELAREELLVDAVILWSPVLDLPAYVRTLEMQQRLIEITLGLAQRTLRRSAEGMDLGGLLLTTTLLNEMRATTMRVAARPLDILCLEPGPRASISVEVTLSMMQLQGAGYTVDVRTVDDEPLRAQVASPYRSALVAETVRWLVERYATNR